MMPAGFHFVIPAPDGDAWMIAQPLDLLDRFLADILLERNVAGNHVAAETEFLPDEDAEFVADIVEILGLIVAAAPLAQHVHMSVTSGFQNLAVNFGGDSVGK